MEPTGDMPPGLLPSGRSPRRGGFARLVVPAVVVSAVLVGVVAAVAASGGTDDESAPAPAPAGDEGEGVYLDPALPFSVAEEEGSVGEIDWGERCDLERGRLALPLFPQQLCFRPWEGGDNGGATTVGVTADSIRVVVYLTQDDDPVLNFVYQQVGVDDTADEIWETYRSFADMFSRYYETYGREIELVRFDATGNIGDAVAATADAETIANDLRPFMVLNGPLLTSAFADTLARNGVMCVSCTPGQPADWFEERAPYVWSIAQTTDQRLQMVAEYVGRRLAGRPAVHAGDPTLAGRERVFGLVAIESSDQSARLREEFESRLADDWGVTFAEVEVYASPTDLSGTGRDVITRLKEAGVTTVVFDGDPLAPQTLTRIATEQDFAPEWVITGSVLTDTNSFARTYDQEQWAHAFGPSILAARVAPTAAGALYLHDWYYDEPPPAEEQAALILPSLQFLFNPLQAVGTDLTAENFRRVLFGAPIIPSTPISPRISYGDRGLWPATDFAALDDLTEVWWDPAATGVDELGRPGTGMWRFVDGGRRYLPGEWPEGAPEVFVEEGSVVVYDEVPEDAVIPTDYEPLR